MGIGGCIALLAAGAILTFAVDWQMSGVNIDLIGLILMAVGIIGLCTYVSISKRRRVRPVAGAPMVEIEEEQRGVGY